MQKDTIVKISSNLQRQKTPEGIRITLENHFFLNWKRQLSQPKTFQKTKNREKNFSKNFLMKVSGKSHSAKTLRSPFCSQNVSFLVKIDENNLEKNRMKKSRSSKNKILIKSAGPEKIKFKTKKNIYFEKSHNTENCKRGKN